MQDQERILNEELFQLFVAHNVEATLMPDGKVFTSGMLAHCLIFERPSEDISLVQLDVLFQIGLDKTIIESSVGFGTDLNYAIHEAFRGFTSNSFHVILSAFCYCDNKCDDRVIVSQWKVDNESFNVVNSLINIRGKAPELGNCPWIDQFKSDVKNQYLTEGIHWIRLFYAFMNNKISSCEVLLDNEPWDIIQNKAMSYDVPPSQDYYSLRIFYILQNGWDIGRLAAIMKWILEDKSILDVDYYSKVTDSYKKLLKMSPLDADRAFYFILLAISHAYFDYSTFDGYTTIVNIRNNEQQIFTIDLQDEPRYIQVYNWAKQALTKDIDLHSIVNLFITCYTKHQSIEAILFSDTINRETLIIDIGDYK